MIGKSKMYVNLTLLFVFAVILSDSLAQNNMKTAGTKGQIQAKGKNQLQPTLAPGGDDQQTEEVTVTMVYEYDVEEEEAENGTAPNKTLLHENKQSEHSPPKEPPQPQPGPPPQPQPGPMIQSNSLGKKGSPKNTKTKDQEAVDSLMSKGSKFEIEGSNIEPKNHLLNHEVLENDEGTKVIPDKKKHPSESRSLLMNAPKVTDSAEKSATKQAHKNMSKTPKLQSLTLSEIFDKPQQVKRLDKFGHQRMGQEKDEWKKSLKEKNGRFNENGRAKEAYQVPNSESAEDTSIPQSFGEKPSSVEISRIGKKLDKILEQLKSRDDNKPSSARDNKLKVGESQVEVSLTKQIARNTRLIEKVVRKVPKGSKNGLNHVNFDDGESEESTENYKPRNSNVLHKLSRQNERLVERLVKKVPKEVGRVNRWESSSSSSEDTSEMSYEDLEAMQNSEKPRKRHGYETRRVLLDLPPLVRKMTNKHFNVKRGGKSLDDSDSQGDSEISEDLSDSKDDDDNYDTASSARKGKEKRTRCVKKRAKKLRCFKRNGRGKCLFNDL